MLHGWWALFAWGLLLVALVEGAAWLPVLVRAAWDDLFACSDAAWAQSRREWR